MSNDLGNNRRIIMEEMLMKLNIQMFAEENSDDGQGSNDEGNTDNGDAGNKAPTFTELLKNPEYQTQ